jgi:hypothetical protein
MANVLGLALKQDIRRQHCKKRLAIFPSPAGMSLTKLTLRGIINYSLAGRVWLGTEKKSLTFFLQCRRQMYTLHAIYDIGTIKLVGKEGKPITVIPIVQFSALLLEKATEEFRLK